MACAYYTGILFEVYAENVGFVIGSGGRYNKLLGHFDSPAPATGFGLRIDRLIEALHMKEEPCDIAAARSLLPVQVNQNGPAACCNGRRFQ